jgi:hypothetical protein
MRYFLFLFIIVLVIFFVEINPSFFIKENYECGKVKVYYSGKDFDAKKLCDVVEGLCFKTNFCNFEFKIFITPSENWFKFFSFFKKDFVWVNPFRRYSVIYPIEISKNKFLNADINLNEKISEIILREFLLNRKTILEYLIIPKWKIIGYSKYVSDEIQKFDRYDICNSSNQNQNVEYKDFEYMMVVKYIFEQKRHLDLMEFFDDNLSYDYYFSQMKSFVCAN